ncbi:MAG: alginate export family protein [Reichenbachiella sp.]
MKQVLYLALLAVVCTSNRSFGQFTLTAEINARPEFRNGFKAPKEEGADPAFFVEQRSRLYANYKEEKFELQITLQDVRMWGANGQVHKTDNAMTALAEGWGRYYFTPALSFKAGRQMISYDNQRFFGGLEWAMQGRRHDALLFMYETENKLKIHTGFAFNQNPSVAQEPVKLTGSSYPPPANGAYHAVANYKHMEYAYLNKQFDAASLSVYLVNEGRQYDVSADSLSARQTYGMMGMKEFGNFKVNAELFYQGGKVESIDLGAYMFSVSATIKTDITPITIGYDHLSGDDPTSSDKKENFAPAFGTNHAFYGFMDYFYVGNGHSNKGLQDIFLKTKFSFGEKGGSLSGHLHYFMAASDIVQTDGTNASAGLGTEVDLVYVKKLIPAVTWKLGYSHMFATESMELIKGGDASLTNNWAWTQIIFKPQLFKSKVKEDKS